VRPQAMAYDQRVHAYIPPLDVYARQLEKPVVPVETKLQSLAELMQLRKSV